MEEEVQATTHPPPRTPSARSYSVGDLLHVFQGTRPNVRGRNTVAYIGRIVGFNEGAAKWEVQSRVRTYL
jgi:hypothetical protein